MPESALVTCDTSNSNDNDSDQPEHSQPLESDSLYHQGPRHNDNGSIKEIEAIHQEGTTRGECLQDDLSQEDCEEDEVDRLKERGVVEEELGHGKVEKNEDRVQADCEE